MDHVVEKQKEIIGDCIICGEPSTGKHYGILSCLGCKTFFRRAVVQRQETVCTRPVPCDTNLGAKKMCRSCRYRKCLDEGMTKEALQPRRDLIGYRRYTPQGQKPVKRKRPEDQDISTMRSDSVDPPSDAFLLEMMHRLTEMDNFVREKRKGWIKAHEDSVKLAKLLEKNCSETLDPADNLEYRITLGCDVSSVTQTDIQAMLEWANTLPAFRAIEKVDQMYLAKRFSVLYLILEHGFFTASSNVEDAWLISNGTCMPRNMQSMPHSSSVEVSEDRRWRQEKLYKQMTECCIDEVALPLRALQLSAEELVTLKIIMLFQCGNHPNAESQADSDLSETTRNICSKFRDLVIAALFAHYRCTNVDEFPVRFGNVILAISGISTAASAMLESYQVMRLFGIVQFDRISAQLLFNESQ